MKLELGAILRNIFGPVFTTGHTGFNEARPGLLLEFINNGVAGYSLPPEAGVCDEKNSKFDT
jgi:hypothetical protein